MLSYIQEYDQLTAQQKEIEEKLQELESSPPRFSIGLMLYILCDILPSLFSAFCVLHGLHMLFCVIFLRFCAVCVYAVVLNVDVLLLAFFCQRCLPVVA